MGGGEVGEWEKRVECVGCRGLRGTGAEGCDRFYGGRTGLWNGCGDGGEVGGGGRQESDFFGEESLEED